jgi:uncharacterized protein YecT (DUF1311 family)
MRLAFVASVVIGCASSVPECCAQTANQNETPEFKKCMDDVDLSASKNSQWLGCYSSELQRQDKALNVEYKLLQDRIQDDTKPALAKAELAWLNFRESWCRYEGKLPSGPSGEVNFQACMVDSTISQINKLKNSFD